MYTDKGNIEQFGSTQPSGCESGKIKGCCSVTKIPATYHGRYLWQEAKIINQKISHLYDAVENGLGNQETYNRINGLVKQRKVWEESFILTTAKANTAWTKEKIVKYMKEKQKALSSSDTATCK